MSDPVTIALIATIPPTVVALLAFFSSKKNAKAIQVVHLSINSRMDQLLTASKAESRAEGVVAGKAEPK